MAKCSECGKEISMPFRCKFCGKTFCSKHRLPENHQCEGLEEYKKKAREDKSFVYEPFRQEEEEEAESLASGLDMAGTVDKISSLIPQGVSYWLIGIIFLVFLAQSLFPPLESYFALNVGQLPQQPWTVLTHIFLHAGPYHFLVNMIVLFFFGPEIERRLGGRKFLEIFFVAGVVAALGFTGFSYLRLVTGGAQLPIRAVGASGAIFGILASLAIIAPNLRVLLFFIIPLKLKHAIILITAVELVILTQNTPIASSAHLTGLLVGLYYGYKYKSSVQSSLDLPFGY